MRLEIKNKNRKDGELKWQRRKKQQRKVERKKEERKRNDSLLYLR
jgi:hypothetical protein